MIFAVFASLWNTLHVEFSIFSVTLVFALVFRGISSELTRARPSKTSKLGRDSDDGGSSCGEASPSLQKPRRAQAAASRGTRPVGGAEQQGHKVGNQAAAVQRRKQPAQIMDEIVDSMREQPSTRTASRALELYYMELQEQLRRHDLRLAEAARGARHRPIDFYSTLVQCAVKVGQCHLIEDIIDDMVLQRVSRPLPFYESTMKQLAGQKHYHLALAVYDRLAADELEPSAVTCSCLISFAAEIGELERAVSFFKKLSSLTTPSIRAYMTILRVYGRRQDWASSLATFRDMQRRRVQVDSPVLNVILATGVSAYQLDGLEALFMEAENYDPPITDVVSYNTMAKCYAQHNDFDKARGVIHRLRRRGLAPNAITFNSVMDGAVRSKRTAEAWNVLEDMRAAGLKPDKYTCSILVKGLGQETLPGQVQRAMAVLHENDSALDKSLRTTLYHTTIEAAVQSGNSSVLAQVIAQARQHHVVPTAASCKRLRELTEAQGTA